MRRVWGMVLDLNSIILIKFGKKFENINKFKK